MSQSSVAFCLSVAYTISSAVRNVVQHHESLSLLVLASHALPDKLQSEHQILPETGFFGSLMLLGVANFGYHWKEETTSYVFWFPMKKIVK